MKALCVGNCYITKVFLRYAKSISNKQIVESRINHKKIQKNPNLNYHSIYVFGILNACK